MDMIPLAFQSAADSAATTRAATEAAANIGWWITLAVVVAIPIVCLVLARTTRMGIIASATFKEAIRQPLFLLLLVIAVLLLIVNTFLPFFSLGGDIMMLKDTGLATLLVCGLFLAVWTASTAIADEIEGKTAMTLLSKPINRRQFITGKYLGILEAVMLMLTVSGVIFLACIYYKVGYDARESSKEPPPVYVMQEIGDTGRGIPLPEPARYAATVQIIPGLLLIFLEIAVLGAISVAISTRLPMVVNLTTCFTIFVIGHLTPVMVLADGTGTAFEIVRFVGLLLATVLPGLELFGMTGAVARSAMVPPGYVGLAALYAVAFSLAAILMAFILFEDRDLA